MSAKRSKKKRLFVLIVILVIAVAAALIVPKMLKTRGGEMQVPPVQSAKVTKGNLMTTLSGTGVLSEHKQKVTIPYNVAVKHLLVADGQEVKEGDPIVMMDADSIMERIAAARNELSTVNDEIFNLVNAKTEITAINAKVAGRVKAIHVESGSNCATVMGEAGTLMRISLDGLMCADFKSETQLNVGTKVQVMLANGASVDGIIERGTGSDDAPYRVTLTDDGTNYGETVGINYDGNKIGEGTLEIHEQMIVPCALGTVKSVNVSNNARVYVGTKLMTIEVPKGNANYESLSTKRDKLVAELNELNKLASDSIVTSPCSGQIHDITISDGQPLAKGDAMTITRADKINLCVNIDELDISKLKKEMDARVAVDATGEKDMSGIVKEIADKPSDDKGAPKYMAVIELDKTEAMKVGMSANATIIKEKKDDVLTIPAETIQEYGDRVFVYTGKDKEAQMPKDEVDITTGLSDGKNVEVKTGLKEGDKIYYMAPISDGNGLIGEGAKGDAANPNNTSINVGGEKSPDESGKSSDGKDKDAGGKKEAPVSTDVSPVVVE
ncbi:MAG: HlyD family efflux transporter periplasmic adaptor subunit [Clostridiales Family XIII bacterium]|jgi:HlyD family secretion protein|nr:HlyD family efflux transporter periplasmic adaptor subunit [Clostridiales Family XIII bacterium]